MDFTLLLIIIGFALIFDYINGFHDAANSIATVVSTKVLTPFQAVLWAAFFNFVAYFLFDLNVADTVAKTADTLQINLIVILAGIIAAIVWNLLTWFLGIPSSSSHTLIGGFAGAAIAHGGFSLVNFVVMSKIAAFIFLAPFIGMFIAYTITIFILHICKKVNPSRAEWWFKKLQLFSSAIFSIGHGGNDAQKVMGIISAAIIVYVMQSHIAVTDLPFWLELKYAFTDASKQFYYVTSNVDILEIQKYLDHKYGKDTKTVVQAVFENGNVLNNNGQKIKNLKLSIIDTPFWVPLACYSAIAIGTMSGGWKIVKTMGSKITKVTPLEGVAAETAGAITLFLTEALRIPVSTTHTITGAIIGVGITKRISAVRWGVTISLLWAWILTIPVSALLAAFIYYFLNFFL